MLFTIHGFHDQSLLGISLRLQMRKFKFMDEAGIYNLVKNQNCLIIWHYDSKGSYKVRSGYKLAMIEKSQTASLVHHLITSGGSPFGILTVENIVHMPYFGVNQLTVFS
ncbi:hypothetical protein ACOSP7_026088 [Xanthoceras sorbifolium]